MEKRRDVETKARDREKSTGEESRNGEAQEINTGDETRKIGEIKRKKRIEGQATA